MSFPTIFANLPGSPSTNPASLLDTMFNLVGAQGAIPCTATGTNAITVTPITNYYLPAAYANYQIVSFVAVANASGAVTIRLGALAFVKLFMPSGIQANSGDININDFYIAAFNGALDSGNGGFQVFNASTPSVVQGVVGAFKNLKITNGGTPDTQVAVTADQVMLGTSGGGTARVTSVNVTISTASTGANALDAGTIATATWYYIFIIYNGSTIAGLMSLSATNPTLPATYTYFARVGAISTGVSPSTNLTRILQYGRDVQYVVTPTSQTVALPVISNSVANSLTAYSVSPWVPPTASKIKIQPTFGVTLSSSTAVLTVAPNANYTSVGVTPYAFGLSLTGSFSFISSSLIEFVLESTNIYAAQAGANGSVISCLGWCDNL